MDEMRKEWAELKLVVLFLSSYEYAAYMPVFCNVSSYVLWSATKHYQFWSNTLLQHILYKQQNKTSQKKIIHSQIYNT